MDKLLLMVIIASLALAGCAKKAVKDPSPTTAGTTAPHAVGSATNGSQPSPPVASTSAGAAKGTGTNDTATKAAGANNASASAANAGNPPHNERQAPTGVSSAPSAAAGANSALNPRIMDDSSPGRVAAAKPLEGLPPPDNGASGSPTPPNGTAAGLLAQRSVYFNFDNSEVAPGYFAIIEAHAKFLADHPSAKVIIQGNADERGSDEYNLALGQRRSDAVRQRMYLLGVAENQIETISYGKEKPRNPGHDESAWHDNRRADIVYRGE